jgi:hypothetical protein
VVVDHHVDVCEARQAPLLAACVGVDTLAEAVTDHAVAGAVIRDPAERLDVDVDELARVAALVAVWRVGRREPRALAEADPLEPGGDGRQRDPEDLFDLGRGHPEPAQLLDRVSRRGE